MSTEKQFREVTKGVDKDGNEFVWDTTKGPPKQIDAGPINLKMNIGGSAEVNSIKEQIEELNRPANERVANLERRVEQLESAGWMLTQLTPEAEVAELQKQVAYLQATYIDREELYETLPSLQGFVGGLVCGFVFNAAIFILIALAQRHLGS